MAELVIPIRLTPDDLDAIASAVVAQLQPNFAQVQGALTTMSQTINDQLLADVQAIKDVVTRVTNDVQQVHDMLSSQTASAEVMDKLSSALGDLRGAADQLDAVVVPPAPPAP